MGCKCKKDLKKMEKYADNTSVETQIPNKKISLKKVLFVFSKTLLTLIIGILAIGLFIVIGVPLIMYVIFCNIIGKEVRFSMGKIINRKKKLNGNK